MNLSKCERACSYQKDGFCRLDKEQKILNGIRGDCIYCDNGFPQSLSSTAQQAKGNTDIM